MIPNKSFSNIDKSSISFRRLWHLALIFIILTLLFFVTLLLYNEIINEKKLISFFKDLNATEKLLSQLDSTNTDYIKGQESLFNYLISDNKDDIKEYFSSINKVKNMMDMVHQKVTHLDVQKPSATSDKNDAVSNQKLTSLIDSLSQNIMQDLNQNKNLGNTFKKLEYSDLALKTTIETKSSVDSVEKKKFFGRLGDALKGNVEVQKEKNEVLMILEHGGQKTEGTIDEQMGNVIKIASDHYDRELKKINKNFAQLSQKNKNLLTNTLIIQTLSDEVFNHYKETLMQQKNILAEKYNTQYTNNRTIRLYALLGLATVLILLTAAVLYLTKTTYDIEQKLVEARDKLTDNLKLKNKIVSMISHDIRSPLNIILLYIKQVLKLEKDPQKTEVFNSINYTTNSAYLLANRILDFSKDENGQVTVYKDMFNLHHEINSILEAFNTLAKERQNTLINLNQIQPESEVVFDRSKLQRLYFNLLDNAIKHTQGGEIEVTSSWEELPSKKYNFSLTVKDSGEGIPEESLKKVFEPFQKATSKMLENQNLGVGLGLYLCKEITELFDGTITVQSKLNQGTTVTASVVMDKK